MGGYAPLHTAAPGGATLSTHPAYNQWADHYNRCPICNEHDWYIPGAPRMRTDPPAKRESAHWYERVINGELYWFRNVPDLSVLCVIGRRLFRQWEQAVLLTVEAAR